MSKGNIGTPAVMLFSCILWFMVITDYWIVIPLIYILNLTLHLLLVLFEPRFEKDLLTSKAAYAIGLLLPCYVVMLPIIWIGNRVKERC